MLRNVCAVCSAMSSLIILPVVGSKPPWPERKIHSPTERPGEYGPAVVGASSELINVFMGEPPCGFFCRLSYRHAIRPSRYAMKRKRFGPALPGWGVLVSLPVSEL